jgi:hypothetical protein
MTPAITSRASSSAARAWRAKRCEPDGFAYDVSRCGSIASIASRRIGVVAA